MSYLYREWVNEFIIGMSICPFSKTPFENNKIQFITENSKDDIDIIDSVNTYLEYLSDNDMSSILIFYPHIKHSFYEFYDLLLALKPKALDKNIDLICFHPKFHFQDTDPNLRVNYVNRSPVPMIHLLPQKELESISKEQGLKVNKQNEKYLNSLSLQEWDHYLKKYGLS
jgi:hypothetical protein